MFKRIAAMAAVVAICTLAVYAAQITHSSGDVHNSTGKVGTFTMNGDDFDYTPTGGSTETWNWNTYTDPDSYGYNDGQHSYYFIYTKTIEPASCPECGPRIVHRWTKYRYNPTGPNVEVDSGTFKNLS